MELLDDHPQFFTATINKWKPALALDEVKQIIIDSMAFLCSNQRVFIYAFVIMNNHIHLIWQIRDGHYMMNVQRDFLKFTGQQIKFHFQDVGSTLLDELKVDRADRQYQIWRRDSLNVPLYSRAIFDQKLNYIHNNPVKAGYCVHATDYRWSSARFYELQDETYKFLSHHEG